MISVVIVVIVITVCYLAVLLRYFSSVPKYL